VLYDCVDPMGELTVGGGAMMSHLYSEQKDCGRDRIVKQPKDLAPAHSLQAKKDSKHRHEQPIQ
jgi:hypothetical protein